MKSGPFTCWNQRQAGANPAQARQSRHYRSTACCQSLPVQHRSTLHSMHTREGIYIYIYIVQQYAHTRGIHTVQPSTACTRVSVYIRPNIDSMHMREGINTVRHPHSMHTREGMTIKHLHFKRNLQQCAVNEGNYLLSFKKKKKSGAGGGGGVVSWGLKDGKNKRISPWQ